MITQSIVTNLFYYKDNNLYWKNQPYKSHFDISKPAGSITNRGYRAIMINRKHVAAHRAIFLYHHGYLPRFLDHIDNDRLNNNIDNLRPSTSRQNNRNASLGKNNTSGVKGVSWCVQTNKWAAKIRHSGIHTTIGRYKNIDDAEKAIRKAREKYHGEFANHG